VSFEDAAAATGLRRASSRAGTLRIVTIDRLDRSACGGTHVRATGEIGPILVRKVERVRRATRLEFVCGMRAVRRARADFDMLSELARTLSASTEEVPALVRAQGAELRAATAARRELEGKLNESRARELYATTAPDASGMRRVLERRPAGPLDELRGLAQAVAAQPRAVFVGAVSEPAGVILAASEDSGIDAGAELKRALAAAGGRGGGSPRIAQGSVPDLAALERLLTIL
jgi:alanyl-tRNA synthetase